MSPPRASSADKPVEQQTAVQIAARIEEFLEQNIEAAVLEDGKVIFDLRSAKASISTEHDRCTLHLWSEDRNLVRQIVSAIIRSGSLRLETRRFGQAQTKLLELVSSRDRRTPTTAEAARKRYLPLLERVLGREFPDWSCEGFRTAMDLERSFGPAYARGSIVRGSAAWAVIGINQQETAGTIDGILTLGILWLHHCREGSGGRRLYQGLKLVLPRGSATLTLSRMAWLNTDAAQWELWELDETSEQLTQRDTSDHGNLRTRLVHLPDYETASERFAPGAEQILALVPPEERQRVEQRLHSTSELLFLVHGMQFARVRIALVTDTFTPALAITVGAGVREMPLTDSNRAELSEMVAELFARRRAAEPSGTFARRSASPARMIGPSSTAAAAHARLQRRPKHGARNHAQDPLYRAAPERWLESMLRGDLAPLTRNLAPSPQAPVGQRDGRFANELDPDTVGNRADIRDTQNGDVDGNTALGEVQETRVIPRLDPHHVYAQVPAIAGASDRGLLDLLGVTADGRLAVIELKVDDDLHFALQGLDYWIRVRHHHLQTADASSGLGEFQRHGYFRNVQLSPLSPRLYLVAPSLHIHPATEIILRYVSPRVEWNLLALDERWRHQIRVVWRKQSSG